MRIIFAISAAVAVAATLAPLARGSEPTAPTVSSAAGRELTALARSAMLEYLRARTPALKQDIPRSLHALAADRNGPWGAVVTVRYNGKIAERICHRGTSLPRNVISAALTAMRSEHLPDRVNADVVNSMIIEVEIIGPPAAVAADAVPKNVSPGLTGVLLQQAGSFSVILPSAARQERLSPAAMVYRCRMGLPAGSKESIKRPLQWSIFATQHFVSIPGRPARQLFRGKAISTEPPTEKDILAAAGRVGNFLLRHQGRDGAYTCAQGPVSLTEHLHATYAMALLARRTKTNANANNPAPAAGVSRAMALAARSAVYTDTAAYLQTRNGDNQLAATAWMALAANELPDPSPQARASARQLIAGILAGLSASPENVSGRLDGTPGKNKLHPADVALAVRAIDTVGSGEQKLHPAAAKLRAMLQQQSATSPLAAAWTAWAGAKPKGPLPQQIPADAPVIDRRGGCALPGREPSLALTAVRFATADNGATNSVDPRALARAKAFCYRLLCKDGELWYLSDARKYRGAARTSPANDQISLSACAAAIELLLHPAGSQSPARTDSH